MSESKDVRIYVCPAPSDEIIERFPDNLFGNCDFCGDEITFRPDAPTFMKKSCFRCAAVDIAKAKAIKDQVEFKVWNKKECIELLKKLVAEKERGQ